MKKIKYFLFSFLIFLFVCFSGICKVKAAVLVGDSINPNQIGSHGNVNEGGAGFLEYSLNKKCCLDWIQYLDFDRQNGTISGNAHLIKWYHDGDDYDLIRWQDLNFYDAWLEESNPWYNEDTGACDGTFYGESGDDYEIFHLVAVSSDFEFGNWIWTENCGKYEYNLDTKSYELKEDRDSRLEWIDLDDVTKEEKEKWIDKSETRKDPEVNTSVYRISKVYLNNNEIYNKDNDGAFKDENGNFDVSKFYYNGLTNWNYDGVLNNGENAKYNIIYQKVDYHKEEVTWERTYEECTSHSDKSMKGEDTVAYPHTKNSYK